MTLDVLLLEAERLGILLTLVGDRLHIQARKGVLTPALQNAITTYKPDLMKRLAAPPPDALGEPCERCGSKEQWRWLDGRLLCRPCLIADRPSPSAREEHIFALAVRLTERLIAREAAVTAPMTPLVDLLRDHLNYIATLPERP
jgi:tubulysin polyketide synthase-like protein